MRRGLVAAAPIWVLLTYLALVLVPEGELVSWLHGTAWVVELGGIVLLTVVVSRLLRHRRAAELLLPAALAAAATILTLLAADNVYFLWERLSGARAPADFTADFDTKRLGLAVQRYYPTDENFQVYRPNVHVSGYRYGDLYTPALLQMPDVARVVLTRRHVTYAIDRHGFRETTPLEQARIFALGDSLTFGGSTDQPLTWPKRLEESLGTPTYNLGVSGASPRQEYLLLEHLLASTRSPLRLKHLLWMIFEGNDLEDSYEMQRPQAHNAEPDNSDLELASWLAQHFVWQIRDRSILHRALSGTLRPVSPPALYDSRRHGLKLFHRLYATRAALPPSYVETHPNRARLESTLRDMRDLAARHKFRVTVVLAPSAERLYAPYYEKFPSVSPRPYFLEHVEAVARDLGLGVLNLYAPLRSRAGEELLYYRDDTHWNERGHEVVAEVIAARIFQRP